MKKFKLVEQILQLIAYLGYKVNKKIHKQQYYWKKKHLFSCLSLFMLSL